MSVIEGGALAATDVADLEQRTADADTLAKHAAEVVAVADTTVRVLHDREATLDAECLVMDAARKAGAVIPAHDSRRRDITMARVSLEKLIAEAHRETVHAAALAHHISAQAAALADMRTTADKTAMAQQGESK